MAVIDVGPVASDRGDNLDVFFMVDKENPADGDGILDTFEIYGYGAGLDITDVKVGTIYIVVGNNCATRDHEDIGAIAKGSLVTLAGLSIDVEIGDFVGINRDTGAIEMDVAGGTSLGTHGSADMPFGSTLITFNAGFTISIHATGDTGGGGATATPKPSSASKLISVGSV